MPDSPRHLAAWQALDRHQPEVARYHLRDLFARDPDRFERFSAHGGGLFLDYSKNLLLDDTKRLLVQLADESRLADRRGAMFGGDSINATEHRAVLHTALRNRSGDAVTVKGADVMPDVRRVLARMRRFSDDIRSGALRGFTGRAISDVVNIGIGGSDLGPLMACEALEPFSDGIRTHFVSNVDGAHLCRVLKRLDPETCLFIIASKTFTTQETLANARTARAWLIDRLGNEAAVADHFAAVSTNLKATGAFGIAESRVFEFWDWVGGRYSLWSAIGLPIALFIGMDAFEEMLQGGHDMDVHFREADFGANLPVILALLGIWYGDFFGRTAHAVLPYAQALHRFPAYLQQLDMESNGKRVRINGAAVDYATGPIIWGEPGTNGQHAFFQHLHQSPQWTPCDFILPIATQYPSGDHQRMLIANCLAQSQALMQGKDQDEVCQELRAAGMKDAQIDALLPHKVFPGNRPSNSILMQRLTPRTLGALIALYEHKVFTQGAIWRINSFDQWGVELGKQLAGRLLTDLESAAPAAGLDASTAGLLRHVLASPH